MKKLFFSLFVLFSVLTACHYGADEAQESVERNKKYKTEGSKVEVEAATQLPADLNLGDTAKSTPDSLKN